MASLLLAALLLAAPDRSAVVARVDGAVVTVADLQARLAQSRAAGGSVRPEALVEDLVSETLLAEEARRAGLQKRPEVRAAADAERRKVAADLLVAEQLDGALKVSDAQLDAVFHKMADVAHVSSIVLATREEAQAARERLEKGADFAAEARHSLDPRGARAGGDLGELQRGQMEKALADVAFAAPLGALQGPVQLELGWAVVKVASRQIGQAAELEARRPELRRFAEEQARAFGKAHYLQKLRARFHVALDEAFLKSTGSSADATPEQAQHAVAEVAGRPVRYGDVLAVMARLFGPGARGGHFSGLSVKSEMAWSLVDRLLLEVAAQEQGLDKRPEAAAAAVRAERSALVRAAVEQIRAAVPEPAAPEQEAWYAAHAKELHRAGHRTCSHLVVATREQAEQLRTRARAEPFEDLAVEHSRDATTAPRGGLIGEVDEAQLAALSQGGEPALAQAIRSAKAGEVTPPVQSRAGWHLFRCGAYVPPGAPPLAEVRANVVGRMRSERGDAAVRARIAALRAKAKVSIDAVAVRGADPAAGGARP